jgi:hypothetical protein
MGRAAYCRRAPIGMKWLFVPKARFLLLLLAAVLLLCGAAQASQLIDRKATSVRLSVVRNGIGVVSYRAHGAERRVVAWGAVNALAPTEARPQVKFRLDYSGGWGAFGRDVSRGRNLCGPYRGPKLAWLVVACTAPDGSHWAVQRWRRLIPIGETEGVWELHLSHWTGDPAALDIYVDARPSVDVFFGQFTYRGRPIHGFHSTRFGAPLDTFGRNIYLDTYDSRYGSGWRRENGFLARRPTGIFCYALGTRRGKGTRYRATALGPGVTPTVSWTGRAVPGAAFGLTGIVADASRLCG